MMDHARHLSSPSPTSPFLFHHSERSSFSKSNPLTPLLSSTAVDMTSVDDCFSSPTPTSHHHHHQHSNHNSHHSHHHNHHQPHHHHQHHHHHHHQSHSPFEVVDQRSHSPLVHHHHNSSSNSNNNHHHHHNGSSHHHHHHHHPDSLTGVDDDDDHDGMHNMLSGGSSSSSTPTMPLLTESHSHHSFSRISLEEYSPLSLVEDCDNALPISPSSLACTSHHSFKSSLNGLNKIDSLSVVGGVDVVNGVVDHDDVNDARSLSPSLLSSSSAHHNHNHHHHSGHHHHGSQLGSSNNNNLWSNSSTAISQNTSLLNSHSSTSFLLNQHHQQQLNSLMQQLEPQSLDEPPQPPCLNMNNSNSSTTNFDGHQLTLGNGSANLASTSFISNFDLVASPLTNMHRPSSEPPPSCGTESVSDLECKSLNGQQPNTTSSKQVKRKHEKQASSKVSGDTSVQSTPTRPRRNRTGRNKSSASAAATAAAAKQAELNNKKTAVNSEADKEPVHSSKVHLQLNHHKKLQELQRRLFGIQTPAEPEAEIAIIDDHSSSDIKLNCNDQAGCSEPSTSGNGSGGKIGCTEIVKQEPDSSAGGKDDTSREIQESESAIAFAEVKTGITTRARPSRSRRSRAQTKTSAVTNKTSSVTQVSEESSQPQKVVATEKVEPDTTTKSSSDYTKLADLLSKTSSCGGKSNSNVGSFSNNNVTLSIQESTAATVASEIATASTIGIESVGGEKRAVQTIQLQMSPSLTVMAANANGLLHPITIQQQQPHDNGSSSGIITTSNGGGGGTTFTANQIFCRAQPGSGAQLKGIQMSSNELLKSAHNENVMSTWTLQPANLNNNNQNAGNNNSNNNNNQQQTATIGAHQIAIQVICQDGTSLVLPVSSAAGLNAAVSLTSQHQQLQAVLANNAAIAAHQQRNNNNNGSPQSANIIPLMSVSNIVAQQQTGSIESSPTTSSNLATSSGSGHASSGLAASSPTLAALLDAGSSNRSVGDINGSSGAQSFVSNNLLRKLVSGVGNNSAQRIQIKRGDVTNQLGTTDVTFTTINGGSLVISSPATASTVSQQPDSAEHKIQATGGSGKRIKLENIDAINNGAHPSAQATFTLVDPQGLIITGELDKSSAKQPQLLQQTTSSGASVASVNQQSVVKVNSDTWKQNKTGSASTGNRQVDPTQPFRCEHCNSTFTRLGNFTRHKKIHTVPTKDGQRFKCDVCSKSFLQRCDLARHLHIHRGTEPHRCNICGKGYIRHSDLVTHQRFHNKEKPFGCPQCSKGFCQRGDLNRHLRSIHLQMKPILCPCCNRKFAKQETLLRHLNTAHRSKPGTTTITTTANTAVIAKLSPNFSLAQGDDKQQQTPAITVVTNAVALNNDNNNIQKNATVASLQAIRATLCNITQTVDQSTTPVSGTNISTSVTDATPAAAKAITN